jgi:hypothetical protein
MATLQSIPLSADAIKVRWKEPYVTAALNQKSLASLPKGVVTGFTVTPQSPLAVGVTIALDADGLSIANVRETTGGLFSVSLVLNTSVNVSLISQAGTTCYIALDAQYVVGATTTAQIKVVDAAELTAPSGADLVLLAKVVVPGVGNVVATDINSGYRLRAGDSATADSLPNLNLVTNSTFEATTLGWTNNGFDAATASTDFARPGGSYSLKLVEAVAGLVNVVSSAMRVLPARSYRVSAWLHSPAGLTGGSGGKFQVAWYDAVGAQIGSWTDIETAVTAATLNFEERKALVAAPALAFTAELRVFFDNCSGTLYIDDVEFASPYPVASDSSGTYGGGDPWADTTPNPATTVELQLDKIVSDLAGASGAPKIGNCPSKILTNTFTQLNTFNVGVALPATQKVSWPTWSLTEVSPLQVEFSGPTTYKAGFIQLFGLLALYLTDGTNQANFIQFGATANIGTTQVGDFFLKTNNVNRWKVNGSTGVLESVGGPLAVQGVLDPATAQDAATKNYVDARTGVNTFLSPSNAAHNGNMGIWARGTAQVTDTKNTIGYSLRLRRADRYYAVMRVDVAGSAGVNVIAHERQPYPAGFQTVNMARTILSAKRTSAEGALLFVHELDRDMVRLARGKKLTIAFKWQKGAGMLNDANIDVVSSSGDSWRNLTNYNGTVLGVGTETVPNASIPTSISAGQKVFVTQLVVPVDANAVAFFVGRQFLTGSTTGATDYLDVSEVICKIGDFTTSWQPPAAFPLAGGSYAGEVDICQRFYESSSDLGDVGGVGMLHAGDASAPAVFSQTTNVAADIYVWKEFQTRKRASIDSTLSTFKIWAPDGTADNVRDVDALANVAVNLGFCGGIEKELRLSVSTTQDVGVFFQYAVEADF